MAATSECRRFRAPAAPIAGRRPGTPVASSRVASHGGRRDPIPPDEPHILLIDPDEGARGLLRRLLACRRPGTRFSEAADAISLARALAADPPDAVVSEYDFPGVADARLLEAVAESFPRSPLFVLTKRDDRASVDAALRAGGRACLTKGEAAYLTLSDRIAELAPADGDDACTQQTTDGPAAFREDHGPADGDPDGIAATEALGFASMAAHELREPARAVEQRLEILSQDLGEGLDANGREDLEAAVSAAKRLHQRLDELLAYARLETQPAEIGATDANAAVDEAIRTLGEQIDAAGATVERGDLPVIRAAPEQLSQVFRNLIANAVRYRDVAPPRVRIDAARDGPLWRFVVADNGIGVPAEHAREIFQPFRRLQSDRSGSGLGLAICRSIVDRHGGRIWAEPTDEGTRIAFTMPPAESAAVGMRA